MRRLLDWLQFRGWTNAYWREDAWSSRCPHRPNTIWIDNDQFCSDCGALLFRREPSAVRWFALSSNVTITTDIEWP